MGWIGRNGYLTESEMKNNASLIWDFFGSKGWTAEAVSAMLGNMESESGINPNIWENLTVDYEKGYGLVQWTPATKYIEWGGLYYEDGYRQCERIQYEVENGLQWFSNANAPIVEPPLTFKEFTKSTESVATLANYFLWYYEHPKVTIQENRASQAEVWYKYLTGREPISPSTKVKKMPVWMMCRRFY